MNNNIIIIEFIFLFAIAFVLVFVESAFADENKKATQNDFNIKLAKELKENKKAKEEFIKICSKTIHRKKDLAGNGKFDTNTFFIFKKFIKKYPSSNSSLTAKLIICDMLSTYCFNYDFKNNLKISRRLCNEIIKNHSSSWQSFMAKEILYNCQYWEIIFFKDMKRDEKEKKSRVISLKSGLKLYPVLRKIEEEWNLEKDHFFTHYFNRFPNFEKTPPSLLLLGGIKSTYLAMGKKKKAIEILKKMVNSGYPNSEYLEGNKEELKWLEEEVRKEQEKKKKNSDKSNKTSKNKRNDNKKRKDKASIEKPKKERVKFKNEKFKESDKIKKDKYNETKKSEEAEVDYLPYIIGISILIAAFTIFIVSIKTSKKT